jgi:hypothetical protein
MTKLERSKRCALILSIAVAMSLAQGSCSRVDSSGPPEIVTTHSELLESQIAPYSGLSFHQSISHAGLHQHYFYPNSPGAAVSRIPRYGYFGPNDLIYTMVYLDPNDLPSEVMLQFMDENGSWEHRAFWGGNFIGWGTTGTGSRRQMCPQGNLCVSSGSWQALVATADQLGLAGHVAVGAAYTLNDGKAYWDAVTYYQYNGSTWTYGMWFDDLTPQNEMYGVYWDDWSWQSKARSWIQFGGDPAHTGNNPFESQISATNMAGLRPMSGFTPFTSSFPTHAPPVAVTNQSTAQGTHDLIIVNTAGNVEAFDAYTGAAIWGGAPWLVGPSTMEQGEASPAVDGAYVYNVGRDHAIHKYNLYDGSEVGTGWPLPGVAGQDKAKTSITIASGHLYVGTSNGSGGSGYIATFDLGTGALTTLSTSAGMWQRAGLPFDYVTQRLIVGTGDGTWDGVSGWAESVIGVKSDGTVVQDSYTPADRSSLNGEDLDMSSTNTLILPNNGAYGGYQDLAVQGGKDGTLRLINLMDMNNQGHPGPGQAGGVAISTRTLEPLVEENHGPCLMSSVECFVKIPMAAWINPGDNLWWIFVSSPIGAQAYRLEDSIGGLFLDPMWWPSTPNAAADVGGVFVANGVLYYADGGGLHIVDATTGLDASGNTPPGGSTAQSRQTPVLINGVLYYNGAAFSMAGISPKANNLALRKPAVQSSMINGYDAQAKLATDGDVNGNFYNGSVAYTGNEAENFGLGGNGGAWWQVDLGSNQAMHQVVIFNRTDYPPDASLTFRIVYIDANTGQWTVAVPQTTTTGPLFRADVNITGRYLRVQHMCSTAACGASNDNLHLAEVQVF